MKTATLHDVLTAWQAGKMDYRRAMRLAQVDTLDELYEAANLSGVEIRSTLISDEEAMGKVIANLIRGQAKLKAV